jgi:porphobilinogen synthase
MKKEFWMLKSNEPKNFSTLQFQRPRRRREHASIREMLEETHLLAKNFIAPLFILPPEAGLDTKIPITSLPGHFRLGPKALINEIEELLSLGIYSVVLFPVVPNELKSSRADYALKEDNFYLNTIRDLKEKFPQLVIMTDVALDPYSTDGHDGLVGQSGEILNDETLLILGEMALLQARAGADIIGPSDMMDGRVGHIRRILEQENFTQTLIMSYCAKYASSFYGPFRDALDSAPRFGDKKTYQMNPANRQEALLEMKLDQEEGADILMVKPALSYLDVILVLEQNSSLPIAAYNVSGEYAMIKQAAQSGLVNHDQMMLEVLTSIKRAGAQIILTYFAKEAAIKLASVGMKS